MPGQNDPNALWAWLQSIQPNFGAANPMDPNAIPAAAPQGMPGAIVNGMPAMTRGGPSMGYPAMGALSGALQPQPPPDDGGHGDGPPDVMSPAAMYVAQGGAAQPSPSPSPNGGIGAYPDSTNYPHNLTAPTFNWPASSTSTGMPAPAGSPSAPPKPTDSGSKGPLAAPGGAATPMKRRAGAPNLGYYQGNPRFGTFQYETPNSSASRAPIYTSLNLFGGGGQGAANPNVPAANAQPVSGITSAAGDVTSQAPPDYGPLQRGSWWPDFKPPWDYGPQQRGRRWNPNSNDYSP